MRGPSGQGFRSDERFALELDAADDLAGFRERFHIPVGPDGQEQIYLCGHSLGLQPREAAEAVGRELESWREHGVGGHFSASGPWYGADDRLREPMARVMGCLPEEVALMNGLTVNLHLMLTSFYRPVGGRTRIVLEEPAFPSDRYAVETHLRQRGVDPAQGIVGARPREGEATLRLEDVEALLSQRGDEIALALFSGVNYLTGQYLDPKRITELAHAAGCIAGFDLAHAAGNVPLRLHDWDVDFAVWCNYKYVSGGPGAVAGAFVHRRHASDAGLARLGGWWGNDPETRFRMDPGFAPRPDAGGWQISNPPILALAPLGPALRILEEAGMDRLREKSVRLTGYLAWLLGRSPSRHIEMLTPADPDERGCQLSLRVGGDSRRVYRELEEAGVVCDFREPNVIRLAPVPLYNTFHEVWRVSRLLGAVGEEELSG